VPGRWRRLPEPATDCPPPRAAAQPWRRGGRHVVPHCPGRRRPGLPRGDL